MEIGSYKNPLEFTPARIETICAMWDEMALPPKTRQRRQMDPTGTSGAAGSRAEGGEAGVGDEEGGRGRGEQNNFACFLASPRLHMNSCDPLSQRLAGLRELSCAEEQDLEGNTEICHRGPRHFGSRAGQQNALFTFQRWARFLKLFSPATSTWRKSVSLPFLQTKMCNLPPCGSDLVYLFRYKKIHLFKCDLLRFRETSLLWPKYSGNGFVSSLFFTLCVLIYIILQFSQSTPSNLLPHPLPRIQAEFA